MRIGVLLCALLAFAPPAASEELGISFVETENLRLQYWNELRALTPHAVRTFTNSLEWQRRILGWTPSEPTTVLLKDFSDYGTALAFVAPHSRLIFDVAPRSFAFETFPPGDPMLSFMNHEMVHIATGDAASQQDRSWRSFFFGKVHARAENPESLLYSYLTIPRWTAPRWYIEGSAVFMETWMGGGIGRAQGGYDEMVFRAMVRDDAQFYDPLGLVSRGTKVDFQYVANAYLYGTRFFTWLAYQYSPEKVVAWIRRDEGSARYYSDQFEQVFGLPLEQAWQNWIAFEREFQRRNLEEVRKHPITPHRPLAGSAVGSISRMYYDEKTGELYAAFRYPGVVEHVGALNTRDGTFRRLSDIKRAMLYKVSSFAYDPATATAFYTDDNLFLRDLMAVNVKTGESRMLFENARIGEIVFNPADRSLIGVRHDEGIATLVRVPYPYNYWFRLHAFPYGQVATDLDISPDGKLLSASVGDPNGDQYLRVWELSKVLAGDMTHLSEFRFGQALPESFVFSQDGRYLYGSAYYTGVSNIYRYEVATGAVEAVSNAESGFFRPVPLADGRLVVLTYTAAGFAPATIDPRPIKDLSAVRFLGNEVATKHPVVTQWQVPPPQAAPNVKSTAEAEYYPPAKLGLTSAYPVLQGYKDAIGVGYQFNFADPINFSTLSITAALTQGGELPANEKRHFDLRYRYLLWRADLSWNRSDFYDLFGPTKRSRKGFAARVGYDDILIWDDPRRLELKWRYAFYDKIDTLPGAQNVASDVTRLHEARVGMYYTDVRSSLGAVDDEKGIKWDVVLDMNHAKGNLTPLLHASLDYGWALPLRNSSIWLRNSAGAADGDRADPLANFYFGGFGNNYVDGGEFRPEKRYREYYAFPGFKINEIGSRSYARNMLEWNLPPYVFESVGTQAFHVTWLRPAVFGSVLWTEPGNSSQRVRHANLGAQVDLKLSMLHWYDLTLSLGYAVGYREGQRAGNEWMISLKLL